MVDTSDDDFDFMESVWVSCSFELRATWMSCAFLISFCNWLVEFLSVQILIGCVI